MHPPAPPNTPVTSVPGELHYLAPGSTVLRRFTAPGASVNTGTYESHTVPIRNGRPVQDTFVREIHGFEIVRHRSAVSDFTDKAEVDAVYVPEVIDFVTRAHRRRRGGVPRLGAAPLGGPRRERVAAAGRAGAHRLRP